MSTTSQEILRSTAVSYANHLLTALFLYLAQHGLRSESLTEGNILILAGALVTGGASAGMVVYRKLVARRLLRAAQAATSGTSLARIQAEASTMPLTGK